MSVEWLQWYYLIYALPAAVAVLVLLLSGLGGHHVGHGHAGHHGLHLHAHAGSAHTGHAAPAAGHPGHVVGDHSAAPHAHAGASGHGSERPVPGVGQQLLGFFGVGRASLTIIIGSLLIGWGLFGLAATDFLRHTLRLPVTLAFPPSLAAAGIGALLAAKLFGELAARLMPHDESYAISREGLLGLTGKVVYRVTQTGGRVHLFDAFRTLHVEPARVSPGRPPIEKGTEVIVASMDPERGCLIVEPLGFTRSGMRGPAVVTSTDDTVPLRERDNG